MPDREAKRYTNGSSSDKISMERVGGSVVVASARVRFLSIHFFLVVFLAARQIAKVGKRATLAIRAQILEDHNHLHSYALANGQVRTRGAVIGKQGESYLVVVVPRLVGDHLSLIHVELQRHNREWFQHPADKKHR